MEMLWYTKTEGKIWRSYRELTIAQLYKLNLPDATVFKTRLFLKIMHYEMQWYFIIDLSSLGFFPIPSRSIYRKQALFFYLRFGFIANN